LFISPQSNNRLLYSKEFFSMPTRFALLLVLVVAGFSSGCAVAWNAANTLAVEPAHFPNYVEQCFLRKRTRSLGEESWREVMQDVNAPRYSKDYHKGFVDGFADYLQNGGSGEPPALPPRHYWDEASPQGRSLAEEWFGGFRHGAARARSSGLRDLIVVPISVPGLPSTTQSERATVKGSDATAPGPEPADKDFPPPPRKLQPPDDAPPSASNLRPKQG
jgi:hypothetical protein